MPTMVSRSLKSYDGKPLKPGQKFEVDDERHVRTLVLSRKAELAQAESDDGRGKRYRTRNMTAE